MLKHKQKKWRQIRLFIFGILIGSMVGVSVFWWLTYFNKSDWYFTKQINNWIENLFTSSAELEDDKEVKLQTSQAKKNKNNQNSIDSLDLDEYTDEFYYEGSDPIVFQDSVYVENDSNNGESSDLNSDVRKDELLLVKEFELPNNADLMIDSLMGVTSKGDEIITITVEFWKSPINYRGYKRSPLKVIVYGIKNYEKVDFKMKDGKLIMIDNKTKYLLRNTNVFIKLEPIN